MSFRESTSVGLLSFHISPPRASSRPLTLGCSLVVAEKVHKSMKDEQQAGAEKLRVFAEEVEKERQKWVDITGDELYRCDF